MWEEGSREAPPISIRRVELEGVEFNFSIESF
jgi:hypothetical protein